MEVLIIIGFVGSLFMFIYSLFQERELRKLTRELEDLRKEKQNK